MKQTVSYMKYDHSEGEEVAMVYLHGFMGNKTTWQPLIRQMNLPFLQLTLDMPFHGQAVALPQRSWEADEDGFHVYVEQVAEDLKKMLKTEAVKKYVLVGYSMGARVAMYAVSFKMLKPIGLVVESSGVGLNEGEARRVWDKELQNKLMTMKPEDLLKQWYEMSLFKGIVEAPLFEEFKKGMLKNDFQKIAMGMPYFAQSVMKNFEEELKGEFKKKNMSVLLLSGEWDEKYAKLISALHGVLPHCSYEVVKNASHNTHLMNPEYYKKAVMGFMRGVIGNY